MLTRAFVLLRKASGKTQARQFVEIGDPGTSGGLPWINQCASIAKLRYTVLCSIPGVNACDVELEQDTCDTLYIVRQAFIRVCSPLHQSRALPPQADLTFS